MTSESVAGETHLLRFQELLRELFQFDCADLDFGIYRIMNHKRSAVERFISDQLPSRIAAELETGHLARQSQAMADLERERKLVLENIAGDAIDADGNLDDKYSGTFRGKKYLEAQAAAAPGRGRQAVETDVYNHLYTFFSRYYQDGDFVSKRRYSRSQRYAIPYNGEEVYLHWANSDQYYVKTAEHFNNYDWTALNGVAVRFRLEAANVEQDNVKGDKRFFVPLSGKTHWDDEARTVTVPFEYRPLTAQETVRYGKQKPQDKIIQTAVDEIPRRLDHSPDALAALLGERRRDGQDEPVSYLEHHLRQYTRRNDSDFFIHKDLRGFLSRELDFYLKNEVLNLDNLEAAGERAADGWFQQMRLIKSVGGEIVDFLAQIEDFQKMLWEKRKFVVDTQYCVTLGNVDSEFYPEIAANDAQWEEWRELLGIDGADRSASFLKTQPTLSLDTRHFDADFTDRLLASFDDIDGMTDGLLIHSENWQALNLLEEKYSRSLQCVYIDPPYNTDASAILYKNDYKDSSWLSLMENRLSRSAALMGQAGVLCCAIDDEEASLLRITMRKLFARELGIVSVRSNPAGRKSRGRFSPAHEYAFFFGNGQAVPGPLNKTERDLARYPLVDQEGRFAWNNLMRHGSGDRRQDRPTLFYPIYVDSDDKIRVPTMEWDENRQEYRVLEQPGANEIAVYPVRMQDGLLVEKRWHRGHQVVRRVPAEYRVRRAPTDDPCGPDDISIDFKIRIDMKSMPKTWWDDSRYASANLGAKTIKDVFGEKDFDFAESNWTC